MRRNGRAPVLYAIPLLFVPVVLGATPGEPAPKLDHDKAVEALADVLYGKDGSIKGNPLRTEFRKQETPRKKILHVVKELYGSGADYERLSIRGTESLLRQCYEDIWGSKDAERKLRESQR
jgi:hypothetical protein